MSDATDSEAFRTPPELWGGFECTVARIGEGYRDQLAEVGSLGRPQDLTDVLDLGLSALRYPILWEHVAPNGLDTPDWTRHDRELALVRGRGVKVIAGLCHHGSGPRDTDLLDNGFPSQLARFAGMVAERYPWITAYTPVNEPLTTARFSCLYGHWYPHKRDTASFLKALFNEIWGTVLAMGEIRRYAPDATFIQTEDVGRIFSTTKLAYQAIYENSRRWLSLDLLCGRVGPTHAWYRRFVAAGICPTQLSDLVDVPCPPDVIGVNYYLSSDRFLDEHRTQYPRSAWGGNGREPYADVEAFRISEVADGVGLAQRLIETAERYHLPLAVTELHNGCTREEQLRWLIEGHATVGQLRTSGLDVRAVTAWALMGSLDWSSLLTARAGHYESGAFDTRDGTARPTIIAAAIKAIASNVPFDHPVVDEPGWWHRETRFYVPRIRATPGIGTPSARLLLITGASGTLGVAFARIATARGLPHVITNRADLDIADAHSVAAALERYRPWAVVNAAGYVRVHDAETEQERCLRENSIGPETLARGCAKRNIPLLTFSSDLVFDGQLGRGYVETDATCPVGVYGVSKEAAERAVMTAHPRALLVRTSAFFGPWDRFNFVHLALAQMSQGKPVRASRHRRVSPTYVPDLVHRTLDLLIDGEQGIWHLANDADVSWAELASLVAAGAGFDPNLVVEDVEDVVQSTALCSTRGLMLRPLEAALAHYFDHNEQIWAA